MSVKIEKLTQTKLKFDQYRATRTKRGALPKELWDDAVALTSEFSFFEVSKTLRVNYARLKELAEPKSKPNKPQKFVKLEVPSITSSMHEVSIEFQSKGIQLHLKSNDVKELVHLTNQFLKEI